MATTRQQRSGASHSVKSSGSGWGDAAGAEGSRPRVGRFGKPLDAGDGAHEHRERQQEIHLVQPGNRGCGVVQDPACTNSTTPDVIKARLDDIRHWRQAHQPLGIPSAGSVFRNPPEGKTAARLIPPPSRK